ncbi:MAG: hypothetical protein B7X64_03125 [Halothiobacillus sp. 39-53-45]|nr:MAG: hypothetical protein B7X64_03125 [Halothiobacillus sp. 39-53-45]
MATVVQTEFGTWRVTVRRKGTKTLTKTFKRKTDADNWATQTEAGPKARDCLLLNSGKHFALMMLMVCHRNQLPNRRSCRAR